MNLGIYLKLRHLNRLSLLLVMSAFLSACLPMQKETQCGSNEAFNATRRKCVPVVGSSTTSTVFIQSKVPENSYTASVNDSGISHSVAVSDTYNYGYTVYWYEHYQSGGSTVSTLAAINTASYSFVPSSKPAGDYILEAVLFDIDAQEQLDSVNWNIIVSALDNPTLINPSPAVTAYSYENTSSSETLSVDINNPNSLTGVYYVYVDGVQQGSYGNYTGTQTVSVGIDPSSMTNGIHSVEVKIQETVSSTIALDQYVWAINIVDPDLPIINVANSTPPFVESITVVDGVNFTSSGWLQDDGTALTNLCIQVDNYDKDPTLDAGAGSDAGADSDINVVFFISGNSIGNGKRDTASDGTAGIGANTFCLSSTNLDDASNYLNLSNPDVAESKSINVVTYRAGTTTVVESFSWNVVVRPKNIRPVISIDGSNTSSALGCVATSSVYYTGCTITQSVNESQDTSPVTYGAGAESTFYNDDTNDVDNNGVFAINIDYDPDILDEGDYKVFFQIKKTTDASYQDIDQTSSYTYADCSYDENDTATSIDANSKLECKLRMDAFNDNGPLAPGDYILTAYLQDFGDGDGDGAATPDGLGWGVTPKDSNLVTWELTVVEYQSSGTIEIGAYDDAADSQEDSWLQTGNDCTNASGEIPLNGAINEAGSYYLCVAVKDVERDNYNISVEMENNYLGGGYSTVVALNLQTRTDHNEYTIYQKQITIPEWAVTTTGASSMKVTVQDNPDSASTPICTTCDTTTQTFAFTNIVNVNPAPTFDDYDSANPAAHHIDLNGHKVFAGMPFVIQSSADTASTGNADVAYTDTSQTDGKNVSWKWVVTIDGGMTWSDIDGATGTNNSLPSLIWTPDLDIPTNTTVTLRLCLTDDGTGNEYTSDNCTSDAAGAGSVKGQYRDWMDIEVHPNQMISASSLATPSSGNDVSQWYDVTNEKLYLVYTTGTNIYVEKLGYNATSGALESIHKISFPTEDEDNSTTGYTSTAAYSVSIDGVDGEAIMISYGLVELVSNSPQFRVRRIDISQDRLNFNYCGFYVPTATAPHLSCAGQALFVPDDGADANLELGDATEVTYNSSSSDHLNVVFTGDPTTVDTYTDLILKNSNGDDITFRFRANNDLANNIIGYCNTGCTDDNTRANGLADAINTAAGDTEEDLIPLEFYADSASTSGTVTIHGPAEFDYYDGNQKIAPVIGRINTKSSDNTWYLPIADAADTLQLVMVKGDSVNVSAGLNSGSVSNTSLTASGVMNQEIDNVYSQDQDSVYVATKNTNGNLDIHKVNVNGAISITVSQNDIYDTSGYDGIEDIRISSGISAGGLNDYVYVSSIATKNSGADRNLSLAITNDDLTSAHGDIDFITTTGYDTYLFDIDKASISADPNNEGEVIVAITTNTTNSNPTNAYLIKFDYDVANIGSTSFNFHQATYPKLNNQDIVQNSAIWTTNIFDVTAKGYTNESSSIEDLNKSLLYFGFHQANAGNEINTGFYNIEEESIEATDDTGSGFFPAIIPAQ